MENTKLIAICNMMWALRLFFSSLLHAYASSRATHTYAYTILQIEAITWNSTFDRETTKAIKSLAAR